jgi:hypothetical protein
MLQPLNKENVLLNSTSRGSVIGIATSYWLAENRSSSPGVVKNFHFYMSSRAALGSTQPPNQWVPGAPSPGVKRPMREADHSPPTGVEVKKMRAYISTPPYAFMTQYFIS